MGGWVDGLRWGLQVGLTLHIPVVGNLTCQLVLKIWQSGYSMWSKVCGRPNLTLYLLSKTVMTASTLLVSGFPPDFGAWPRGFSLIQKHRTLMLGDNVIMSQFTTKMLHGVLPSSFIWVSLSGFMHRLGLVCCPTTKS